MVGFITHLYIFNEINFNWNILDVYNIVGYKLCLIMSSKLTVLFS